MKIVKFGKNVTILPGANGNAFSSSKRLYESIRRNDNNVIKSSIAFDEALDWEVGENEKGGIIVFSEEVNAINQSENKLINWLKQKTITAKNKLFYKNKIDAIANAHELVGWTVGRFLDGRYKAKNGKMYGEKSLSVEIIGVSVETLIDIATELAREFAQESVLVKDYSGGRIMFVNRD